MKKIAVAFILSFILFSCRYTSGSGHIVTEKRSVDSFTKISSSNAIDVEVRIGAAQDVVVEADDNIIKHLVTNVSNNEINIGIEDLNNIGNAHLKVFITMPVITSINVSSTSSVNVLDELKYDGKLNFAASSSGSIIAQVKAPDIYCEASSAGSIKLTGKTKNFTVDASSGAQIKAGDLLSENTKASASSGGSAIVNASVRLDANASSGGNISYYGGAVVNKTADSGGSVDKKD